jgi:lipopolysaccharide/colanic/teichoic acid biosynthesis glycosyltransferase
MYRNFFKPLIDFMLGSAGFVLVLPVLILLILFLSAVNRGSPFFLQPRPGKNSRIFRLIKFRTMNDQRDAAGNTLPDAERLTAVGKFIRKTSLDEIPQLLNVIKGDMSLVGPRPLLVEYLPLYTEEQARRHEVRPGITGWAQVNGRNAISWEQKFEYDVWYVDHLSFALDVKILFMSVAKVFEREGINQPGQATMKSFTGTKNKNV